MHLLKQIGWGRRKFFFKEDMEEDGPGVETDTPSDANLVSSRDAKGEMHWPAIDLDVAAHLVPSSRYNHSHLYINRKIEWSKYLRILEALCDAGLYNKGCLEFAKKHKMTLLRTPWTIKEDDSES